MFFGFTFTSASQLAALTARVTKLETEFAQMDQSVVNLQTSVAATVAAVNTAVTDINALIAKVGSGGTINPADIQAQVDALNAANANLQTASAAASAALNPPAA